MLAFRICYVYYGLTIHPDIYAAVMGSEGDTMKKTWKPVVSGVLAIPLGIPLGIISTVFLAQSGDEFK